MKIYTNDPITALNRWAHLLEAILFIAFMVPAVTMSQSTPSPVNLGTSGDFVILAKTGISATGVTQITGDIGVSPIAATGITGFGLIMDPSGTFSTSSLVIGKVYAADYTDPTPTKMTTAVSDMETAYTDAAGRTLPNYTELYAGDLTGQNLTPGLYKWNSGILISAGGVTISGATSDVWIFQIAQNLTLANGAIVTLSGGAQASNIFWQVAGQVNLGTTAAMKGIILCQTQIVMSTGSTLNGRALAQSAVTLDANTVTINYANIPIELTSFSATADKNDVILSWSTTTETNNQGFEIQRRNTNNNEFERVGFVKGNGTTTAVKIYTFSDKDILAGNYGYRLKQVDYDGRFEYSDEIEINITRPLEYVITQNYPNPFNPTSAIRYAIPKIDFVKISIYDMLGKEIKVLVNEEKTPGNYEIIFDAKELASGIYFYKINAGEFSQIKKMILMK
ncbi:MAG: ice-binding family protein [Ignavibacteriales bacterium]|nr:ice-binding family protein [Ignavibacteriales bacterium]